MRSYYGRRQRPPWWPENEPWPPTRPPFGAMRGRFFWRFGCFFLLFIFLSVSVALSIVLFVLRLFGVGGATVSNETLATFIIVVIGLFVGVDALRRVAMPLGEVMEAAGRVAEGDYATRVRVRGPRELRALARAFNTMAERLQTNDEQRRNLMADVAHELRTPLAVIQGNLEGLLDGVYLRDDAHLAPILEETRVLSRLIEDLRTLALAESGALKLQKEPTDLAVLISETVRSFRAQADAAGVILSAETDGELPLMEVDPARIREVLTNLLTNALRYTPRGGTVRVQASFDAAGPRATISVSDSGAGIPAADLPHIFERFYKANDSRGSGLGLTIAKNLINAHAGEIFVESEAGLGTTIRFTLPRNA